MDFASVGSLGSANEFNFSKYTLEISPTSTVPAGDLVVVWATWTSHYFFGPDGEQTPEMSCTDDAGNRYVQLVSSYVFGAYVAMFASQVRNGLATSDTITLKHYGPGAKAVSLEQFTLTSGKRWALDLDRVAVTGVELGDPGSLTISGLDSGREYLLLHVLGVEGPDTDAYTWDSDYTEIAGDGTTNGSGDVHVRGGFRVVTGISSDTVDVASTGTDRDNDQALVAITPMNVDEDFPTFPDTPLLDDFNRANEDPNDGGVWQTTGDKPGFGSALTRVVGNEAAMSTSGGGAGSQYMLEQFATEDALGEYEEWGTIAVEGDVVLYFGEGDGAAVTADSTGVAYRNSVLRAFNAAAVDMGATSVGTAGFTGFAPGAHSLLVWGPLSSGAKIGIQQLTQDVWYQNLWIDDGAGWEWVAASIRSILLELKTDGQFGIGFEGDTATRLDDLGGGMLERFVPQIIRRPPDAGGRKFL